AEPERPPGRRLSRPASRQREEDGHPGDRARGHDDRDQRREEADQDRAGDAEWVDDERRVAVLGERIEPRAERERPGEPHERPHDAGDDAENGAFGQDDPSKLAWGRARRREEPELALSAANADGERRGRDERGLDQRERTEDEDRRARGVPADTP